MGNYYLAIDIGASSGRHILGHLDGGKLYTEEVHRFENSMKLIGDELCWDVNSLFREIKLGMKKCKEMGTIPVSVGIDTWGVDFVLLDKEDKVLGNTVGYRDSRTEGMDEKVHKIISEGALYTRTGIQKQIFNTIYQLMAVKSRHPEYMEQAEAFLMIPDYLHFLLSGVRCCEYTNATTTQLVNPDTMDWDMELIAMLGYPKRMFSKILKPGTYLNHLTEEVQEEVGYNCRVVLPASHDTGSAVAAVPSIRENPLYISSGTWSLMGTELSRTNRSDKSRERNFTNEGGYGKRFRYLKNIMGLWMIQCVQKETGEEYSFSEIGRLASRADIPSIVDCNAARFLAPVCMTDEVKKACEESGQRAPQGIGEVAAVIYNSLAKYYKETAEELEEMTGITFTDIHVVGGGSKAEYLNELTARYTGKTVYAGPGEATAIGNIMVQMMAAHELKSLREARNCIIHSVDIKEYKSLSIGGGKNDDQKKI